MSEADPARVVIIHADGRSDAEGVCTWAFVAKTRGGRPVYEASGLVENPYGDATSLLAEWTATVEALRWAREAETPRSLLLRVDAALVEKALRNRRISMSGYEGALAIEARQHVAALKGQGVHVHVERVPRWRNADADGLTQGVLEDEAAGADVELPGITPGIPPPSRRARRGSRGTAEP